MSTEASIKLFSFTACVLLAHLTCGANLTSIPEPPKTPGPRIGPWTPLKPQVNSVVSVSPSGTTRYHSSESRNQQQRPNIRHTYQPTAQASEPRAFHSDEMNNNFPSPIIKHRENGATVGLDLPDSNLRLLLDIDELASKPISDNIKLKVVERNPNGNDKLKLSYTAPIVKHNKNNNSPQYSTPLRPPVERSQVSHNSVNTPSHGKPFSGFRSAAAMIKPQYHSGPSSVAPSKQYKIGFIRASDLHSALNRGVVPSNNRFSTSTSASQANHFSRPTPSGTNFNTNIQASGQYQVKYSQPLPGQNIAVNSLQSNNQASNADDQSSNYASNQSLLTPQAAEQKTSFSKTNLKAPPPPQPPSSKQSSKTSSYPPTPTQQQQQKSKSSKTSKPKEVAQQKTYDNEDNGVTERAIKSRGPTEKPSFSTPSDKFTSDEQQKHVDTDDEEEEVELLKMDDEDDGFGNEDQQAQLKETPTSTPSTNAHQSLNLKKEDKNDVDDDFDDEEEFAIIKPFPPTNANQETCSAGCQTSCMPSTQSISGDMDSMTVKEFAARIKAEAIFDMFPEMEEQFQTVLDFAASGYTMFLPSNEAIARLPKSLVKR